MKNVAIFGAGISGLAAAHEFIRLGYKVSIYEANLDAGGFFRSARMPEDKAMPSEYSWHGLGPWYHNVFDIMKQIPFDEEGSVYDKSLSRPISYGIVSDVATKSDAEDIVFSTIGRFRMTWWDKVRWAKLLFKTWTSNRRTKEHYSKLNASETWRSRMSDLGWKTWRATFGPWVGCDFTRASVHHVGQFFRRNFFSGPAHYHKADEQGSAWKHSSRGGWLLLRGPSNEFWFDKWVAHLKKSGVKFFFQAPLEKFDFDGKKIVSAYLQSGEEIHADIYVMATNPFAALEIFNRTPELEKLEQLRLFRPLISDGPHTQVSFRIAFTEKIAWSKERTALLLADSEFNLTLFPQEEVWASGVDLGKDVVTLWTGTACVASVAGKVYGLPLTHCTKEQFIEEVKVQLLRCEDLDHLIKKANNGRGLKDFPILRVEVWHEWKFSSQGIKPSQAKWVMSTHTQPYLPTQATPVPNLILAGAHTKTDADIWSIEGAVESGRRAAQVVEPSIEIIPQYKPGWLRAISVVDNLCFSFGLPHIVDLFLLTFIVGLVIILYEYFKLL